jgi:hypothetical protein
LIQLDPPIKPADAAVRYARAGWPVFPLHDTACGHCSCSAADACRQTARHPRTRHGFHDATVNPTLAGVWWTRWPDANLGVATGEASGLVVVDLDGDAGLASWRRLVAEHNSNPDTPEVATPHGKHLWFRLPSGVTVPRRIGLLGDGVDVLGDGGYAIVPPSRASCTKPDPHPPGPCTGRYTWTRRGPLAVLPSWVIDLAQQRSSPESRRLHRPGLAGQERTGPYGAAALAGEVERVATAPRGTRNTTLNRAAWRLGRLIAGGELDSKDAAERLLGAAAASGLVDDDGERAVTRTIRSGLQVGMQQPRTRPPRPSRRQGRSRAL